jgi:hypothetical protein
MPPREETTTFDGGICARCGWPEHAPSENGEACVKCGRRVVFGKVER